MLAQQVSTGDQRALEELLERLHVHVARYYHAWLDGSTGGPALAEALAQEVLIRIGGTAFPTHRTDVDVIAHALRLAHTLAHELGP